MGRQVDQLQASIQSQLEGVSGEMFASLLSFYVYRCLEWLPVNPTAAGIFFLLISNTLHLQETEIPIHMYKFTYTILVTTV